MIASILAIANNSNDLVTLALISENNRFEIANLASGTIFLDVPMVIPLVESGASLANNYVEVSLMNGPKMYLWRDETRVYAHEILELPNASPMQYTASNPVNPVGLHLIIQDLESAGGGWLIGDITGG